MAINICNNSLPIFLQEIHKHEEINSTLLPVSCELEKLVKWFLTFTANVTSVQSKITFILNYEYRLGLRLGQRGELHYKMGCG